MAAVGEVETTWYESLSLIAWDQLPPMIWVLVVTMLRHKEGELILMTADLVNYNSCLWMIQCSSQSMKRSQFMGGGTTLVSPLTPGWRIRIRGHVLIPNYLCDIERRR